MDEPDIGVADLPRYRAGEGTGQRTPADAAYRTDAQACRGHEDFLGIGRVEQVEIGLAAFDAEFAAELEHCLAADPRQDPALVRSHHDTVAYDEDVAADALGQVPLRVEQYRPGFLVLRLGFEVGGYQVQVVVRLGARAQHVGRDAPGRRHDDVDAVAEQARPLLQRQRDAFDDD